MKKNYLLSLQNALCFFIVLVFSGCATIQNDWEDATRLNTIEAYEEFLKKHPYSDRKYQAEIKICDMQNQIVEHSYNKAKSDNTANGFLEVLKLYSKYYNVLKRCPLAISKKIYVNPDPDNQYSTLNMLNVYSGKNVEVSLPGPPNDSIVIKVWQILTGKFKRDLKMKSIKIEGFIDPLLTFHPSSRGDVIMCESEQQLMNLTLVIRDDNEKYIELYARGFTIDRPLIPAFAIMNEIVYIYDGGKWFTK